MAMEKALAGIRQHPARMLHAVETGSITTGSLSSDGTPADETVAMS
jgi:hypothetical protein